MCERRPLQRHGHTRQLAKQASTPRSSKQHREETFSCRSMPTGVRERHPQDTPLEEGSQGGSMMGEGAEAAGEARRVTRNSQTAEGTGWPPECAGASTPPGPTWSRRTKHREGKLVCEPKLKGMTSALGTPGKPPDPC